MPRNLVLAANKYFTDHGSGALLPLETTANKPMNKPSANIPLLITTGGNPVAANQNSITHDITNFSKAFCR